MSRFFNKNRSWSRRLAAAVTAGLLAGAMSTSVYAADYSKAITGVESVDSKNLTGFTITTQEDGTVVYDADSAQSFVMNNTRAIAITKIPSTTIVNADLNIVSKGSTSWQVGGIQVGYGNPQGTEDGTKQGKLIINGDLTMRASDGSWGIDADELHGGYSYYKGARWQPSGVRASTGGHIVLNGDVDLAVRGTALSVDSGYKLKNVDAVEAASITVNGNLKIETPQDNTEAFYAFANYGGTLNINYDGSKITNEDNVITLKGNAFTIKQDSYGNGSPYYFQNSITNIALTNAKSSWTGVIDNSGAEQAGDMNLVLQGGATWTHESMSMTDGMQVDSMPDPSNTQYGVYDGVSHLISLKGGSSAANTGYIYATDKANIQIGNYSGYTTVFYAHNNNGAAASDYTAGNIIIGTAEKGSAINLVTANNGIDTSDSSLVNSVLKALAGKLTYSGYTDAPDNLTGTVEIAGGLTSDRVVMKSGDITFTEGGKGTYRSPDAATEFGSTLTGDADKDSEYVLGSVRQDDGTYKFKYDSTIDVTAQGAKAIDLGTPTTIDATDKTLTLKATQESGYNDVKGITVSQVPGTYNIHAGNLVINATATNNTRVEGIGLTNSDKTTLLQMTIDSDVDINTSNANYYNLGVYASGSTNLVINGDVKTSLTTQAQNYYEATSIYSGGSLNYSNPEKMLAPASLLMAMWT